MKLIAAKIIRIYRIWLMQLYSNIMRRMAYPGNFYLMAIGSLFQMFLSIAFVNIIFSFINNLAGWSYHQALLVVASYMLIEGFMWGTCAYLNGLSKNIQEGTLDGLLVKPIDSQFFVSVWQSDPEDWMRVITAIVLFTIAIKGLDFSQDKFILNLFLYLFLLINSYFIIYSITLVIRSITFWTTEGDGLWKILETLTRLSQYPTDIFYHSIARFIFTAILPLAFISTVPAKILINGPDIKLILASTFLAIIFFIASRKFFHYGLKHYSSASS